MVKMQQLISKLFNKKNKNDENKKPPTQKINVSVDIDYDKLAQSLQKALDESSIASEQRKADRAAIEINEKKELWKKAMGQHEPKGDKLIVKILMAIVNFLCGVFNIIFFRAKGTTTGTYKLWQLCTTMLLFAYQVVFGLVWFNGCITMLFEEAIKALPTGVKFLFGALLFVAFMIERAINMVRVEVKNSEDRKHIKDTFDSVVGFSGMFFGLIAAVFAVLDYFNIVLFK